MQRQQAPPNSTIKYAKFFGLIRQGVEFRVAFKGVNRVCSEEIVQCSGLVELLVVELTGADCTCTR